MKKIIIAIMCLMVTMSYYVISTPTISNLGLSNVYGVNNVYYVDKGSASDLITKVGLCDGSVTCTVIVPPGNYNMTDMINLSSHTHLIINGNITYDYIMGSGTGKDPVNIRDVTDHDIKISGSGSININEAKQTNSRHVIGIGNSASSGVHNIVVDGLMINAYGGVDGAATDCLIGIVNTDNVLLSNNYLTGLKDYGICGNYNKNTRVVNNHVEQLENHGISISDSSDSVINGNVIVVNDDGDSTFEGLKIVNTNNSIFSNNVIVSNDILSAKGVAWSGGYNNIFTDNNIKGFIIGIYMNSHPQENIITNNVIMNMSTDCVQGITSGAERNTINNNIIKYCGDDGIDFNSNVRQISNNHIYNVSHNGIKLGAYVDYAIISNNNVEYAAQDNATASGILLLTGADANTITNNNVVLSGGLDVTVQTMASNYVANEQYFYSTTYFYQNNNLSSAVFVGGNGGYDLGVISVQRPGNGVHIGFANNGACVVGQYGIYQTGGDIYWCKNGVGTKLN